MKGPGQELFSVPSAVQSSCLAMKEIIYFICSTPEILIALTGKRLLDLGDRIEYVSTQLDESMNST